MDTNPVTEAEMREFFQRVVTSFVSLSDQAGQLAGLQQRFATMSAELDQVRQTNNRLLYERDEAITKNLEHEEALKQANASNDYLSQRVHALTDTIVGRDQKVQTLEQAAAEARQAHEAEKRAHEATTTRLQRSQDDYSAVCSGLEHWQQRAEAAEAELTSTKEKLETIEKQLGGILGLVRPAAEQEVKEVQEAVTEVKEAVQEAASPDPTPSSSSTPSPTGTDSQQSGDSSVSADHPAAPWWEKYEPKTA